MKKMITFFYVQLNACSNRHFIEQTQNLVPLPDQFRPAPQLSDLAKEGEVWRLTQTWLDAEGKGIETCSDIAFIDGNWWQLQRKSGLFNDQKKIAINRGVRHG